MRRLKNRNQRPPRQQFLNNDEINNGIRNKLNRMSKDESKRVMERKLFKDMIMKGIGNKNKKVVQQPKAVKEEIKQEEIPRSKPLNPESKYN